MNNEVLDIKKHQDKDRDAKMCIIYGENGTGKTSIVELLKTVSNNHTVEEENPKHKPEQAKLCFDDRDYVFNGSSWDRTIDKHSILFFDNKYVSRNIHIAGKRGTLTDEQEQASGKLIIDLDNEAIKKRALIQKLKEEEKEISKEIKQYKERNRSILDFSLSDLEEVLYKEYMNCTEDKKNEEKSSLEKNKKELEKNIGIDQENKKRLDQIKSIEINTEVPYLVEFPEYEDCNEVFTFEIVEKTQKIASLDLENAIRNNQAFFDKGVELFKEDSDKCPFCRSSRDIESVHKIIQSYNEIFDVTYKKQRNCFIEKKEELISKLSKFESYITEIKTIMKDCLSYIEDINDRFDIPNIYSSNERKKCENLSVDLLKTVKINELIQEIDKLDEPNNKDIRRIYSDAKREYNKVKYFRKVLVCSIDDKRNIVDTFKSKNTNASLEKRMEENTEKIKELKQRLEFLQSNKIKNNTEKLRLEVELSGLEKKLEMNKTNKKEAQDDYQQYCTGEAYKKYIDRMNFNLDKFNLGFDIVLIEDTDKRKNENPFSFKIVGKSGDERDFDDGLSEGEKQVIAICFFFATLDSLPNKQDTIIVIDDPVTSLCNSNVGVLVDLITSKIDDFSQIIILTHHSTLNKFLNKRFEGKSTSYCLLRTPCGGSFICKSEYNEKKFINKLRNLQKIHNAIEKQVQNNKKGIDFDSLVVEYGQCLRYEVERFIKRDLMQYHEQVFSNKIKSIKENRRKIDDKSLDVICDVYSFCNWTTSHVDLDDDNGLKQLEDNIDKFLAVCDKV